MLKNMLNITVKTSKATTKKQSKQAITPKQQKGAITKWTGH